MKAGLFITGNLIVSLEDPKYFWEPITTHDHGNLFTNLIILFIFYVAFVQTNFKQAICIIYDYTNHLFEISLDKSNTKNKEDN